MYEPIIWRGGVVLGVTERYTFGMVPIARLIDAVTQAIWPKRLQQEALFDLPERKRWTPSDRLVAVHACAEWLMTNGVIIASEVQAAPATPVVLRRARLNLAGLAPMLDDVPGVATDLQRIAPLVGSTSAKTLANALAAGPSNRRSDHRWLLALGRLINAPAPHGLRYEDRSQAAMLTLLGRVAGHLSIDQLDALDALIVFSLVALWQRRRPTYQVRANRQRASSRRRAPKPIVRLCDTLITPQQTRALLAVGSAAMRALAWEAALTREHLLPHADRKAGDVIPTRLLDAPPETHDAMYAYRIAVMQAWQAKAPWPVPPEAIADHPYVMNTYALAQHRWGAPLSTAALEDKWNHDWPGKAMLAPALKHRMQGESNGNG